MWGQEGFGFSYMNLGNYEGVNNFKGSFPTSENYVGSGRIVLQGEVEMVGYG